MAEKKDIENSEEEEEFEDLDEMDEFSLDMQEMSDIEGLEDIPEENQVGLPQSDMIITYGEKIVDETEELEKKFNQLIEEIKEGESYSAIQKASDLLTEGKRLDAHYLNAKISSLIASLLTAEQKHKDATEYYLLSVSESRKSEDKKLHLLSLSAFGGNLKHFDLKDAAVVFNQARELAYELGEKEYFAENSIELAHCLFSSDIVHAYSLYQENIEFFEKSSNYLTTGIVRYRIGLINITQNNFNLAFKNLEIAKKNLQRIQDIEEFKDVNIALDFVRDIIKKGKSLVYSLNLPNPEPFEETVGTKKVFEIYSSTGIIDILQRITKKQLKLISPKHLEIDVLEPIFDENRISRLNETDLFEFSKLYEEVGDIYLKETKPIIAFFNLLGSLLLALQLGNMKKAEKIDKKIDRIILDITTQEDDKTIENNLLMYKYYQLAFGLRERNPKLSQSYISQGIEIASKRNNPYFEGLFKEIQADVKSLRDQDKAFVDYQTVISLYQELDDFIDLMRVYEKVGNIYLFTQTDKAKEYLNKALEIANELGIEEIINRLKGKI